MNLLFTVVLIVLGIGAWLNSLDPAWVALMASVFGGVGLKVAEKWLGRNSEKREDRKSYREEIQELQDRLDTVEKSLEDTRSKYFAAQEQVLQLKMRMLSEGINPDSIPK